MTDPKNPNNETEQEIKLETEELEATDSTANDNASTGSDQADDVVFDEDAELGDNQVVKKLREKLKTAVEEKQTYLDGWQRDKAEFMNARKRDEEAKQEFLKFSKINVIEDILPVIDSFDMAMANKASWESISEEWRKAWREFTINFLESSLSKELLHLARRAMLLTQTFTSLFQW